MIFASTRDQHLRQRSSKRPVRLAVALTVVLVGAACSSPGASESDYEAIVSERDQLAADIKSIESELSQVDAEVAEVTAALDAAGDETLGLLAEIDDLRVELNGARSALTEAKDEASALRSEMVALVLKYDAEIRAELEAEITGEVARACTEAEEEYDRSVATIVNWSPEWEVVTSRADLIQEVEDCSAAERSKTAEQRETDRLAACEAVDVDALEKNPDAYRGECIHMWVYIVQYDSNTGVCTFRAEMSARKTSRWYDYDGNALFSSATDPVCPELDGIDNNDFIEVWATGNGTLSYDTQAGGTATATVWRIEKVDLWKKG